MRFEKVQVAIKVESDARTFDFGFQCTGPKEGGLEQLGAYLGDRIDVELESMFHAKETRNKLNLLRASIEAGKAKAEPKEVSQVNKAPKKAIRRRILGKE